MLTPSKNEAREVVYDRIACNGVVHYPLLCQLSTHFFGLHSLADVFKIRYIENVVPSKASRGEQVENDWR